MDKVEKAMAELQEKIQLTKNAGSLDGVDVDAYIDMVRGREDGKDEGERIGRDIGEKLGKQMGEIIVKGLEDEYKKGYHQALKDIEKEIEHRTLNAHEMPNGAKDKEFYCGMDAAFSDMLVFIESLES